MKFNEFVERGLFADNNFTLYDEYFNKFYTENGKDYIEFNSFKEEKRIRQYLIEQSQKLREYLEEVVK